MKRCVAGFRRFDAPVAEGRGRFAPTLWFPSMAAMADALPDDTRAMLRLIHERQP